MRTYINASEDLIAYEFSEYTESIVDIKHFLISLGILENMDDKSIKITKSQASYR